MLVGPKDLLLNFSEVTETRTELGQVSNNSQEGSCGCLVLCLGMSRTAVTISVIGLIPWPAAPVMAATRFFSSVCIVQLWRCS